MPKSQKKRTGKPQIRESLPVTFGMIMPASFTLIVF